MAISPILGGSSSFFIDKVLTETSEQGQNERPMAMPLRLAFFQTLAMMFGVSRSAATIIGAWLGLKQKGSCRVFLFAHHAGRHGINCPVSCFRHPRRCCQAMWWPLSWPCWRKSFIFPYAVHGSGFGYYRIVVGVYPGSLYFEGLSIL